MDAGRIGRADHERRGAGRGHPRRRTPGLARRRARDRRPSEPRGARCVRVDPRRVGASRLAASNRARAVSRARGGRPVRSSRRRVLGAVQPRPFRSRPRRAFLARAGRRRVRVSLAVGVGGARRERLGRPRRRAGSARGDPRRRATVDRRAPGLASRAVPDDRRDARCEHRQPGLAVPRRAPAREAPSGLSRRPRRSHPRSARDARRTSWRRSRSSRPWSAAAGSTTRRRGS